MVKPVEKITVFNDDGSVFDTEENEGLFDLAGEEEARAAFRREIDEAFVDGKVRASYDQQKWVGRRFEIKMYFNGKFLDVVSGTFVE